jgi:hypothetical protein
MLSLVRGFLIEKLTEQASVRRSPTNQRLRAEGIP